MNTTLIVKSSEGVEFAVLTSASSGPYELAFAATKTAAELAAHGDFVRVSDAAAMTEAAPDLVAPEEIYLFPYPCAAGPTERRAAFRLIKGGKS